MKFNLCVLSLSAVALCLGIVKVRCAKPFLNVEHADFPFLLSVQYHQRAGKILHAVNECNQTLPVPLEEGLKIFLTKDTSKSPGQLPTTEDGKCLIDCTMRKMNIMTDNGFQSKIYVKNVKQLLFNYTEGYDLPDKNSKERKRYDDAVRNFRSEFTIVNRYDVLSQLCQLGVEDPKKEKCEYSFLIAQCIVKIALDIGNNLPLFPFVKR